jgi:1-acyl-sn-glycerol-3-phosphate acyltransferase
MPKSMSDTRPLDQAIKDRLHLTGENPATLRLVRGAIHFGDAISRTVSGKPFFGLRESEAMLRDLSYLQGLALIREILARDGGTHITPHGLDNVPDTGGVVIAATHPTGLFDFLAHAAVLVDKRPDLKVVANQEVEEFLGPKLIVRVKIDKQNRATSGRETQRAMITHLSDGGALLIFGSGRVPDRRDGFLVEPAWRKGASKVSEKTRSIIVPAALNTRNSNAYYRTRAIARFLSGGNDNFGAMVASLRYSAELMEKLGGRYDVYYGTPLSAGTDPNDIRACAESLVPGLYSAS